MTMIMMKPNIASAARRTILRSAVVTANRPAIVYFSSNNHKLQKLPIDYLEEARKKMDDAAVSSSHQNVTTRAVHNGIGRRKLQKLPIDYINEAREHLHMSTRSFSTSAGDHADHEVSPSPKFTTYGTAAGKKMHKLAIDYLNDAREKRLSQESRGDIGFNKTSVRSFSTVTDVNEEETPAASNADVVNYGSDAGKKMQKLAIDYLNDAREKRLAEETMNSPANQDSDNGVGRRKLQKLPIDYISEAREHLNMSTRSFSTSARDHADHEVSPSPKFTSYGTAAGKKMHRLAIDYLNDAREKRLSQESRGDVGFNKTSVRSFSTFTCGLTEMDMYEEETPSPSNADVVNYGSAAGKKMQKLAIDYLNDAREKRLAEEAKNSPASQDSN